MLIELWNKIVCIEPLKSNSSLNRSELKKKNVLYVAKQKINTACNLLNIKSKSSLTSI